MSIHLESVLGREPKSDASQTLRPILRPFVALLVIFASAHAVAHGNAATAAKSDRSIDFPDVQGYQTLVVDLHTHSVFSDGHVWPKIRVEEALRDGLDGLAITEHLEYQPHRADIIHPDRNRAFEDASTSADALALNEAHGTKAAGCATWPCAPPSTGRWTAA